MVCYYSLLLNYVFFKMIIIYISLTKQIYKKNQRTQSVACLFFMKYEKKTNKYYH